MSRSRTCSLLSGHHGVTPRRRFLATKWAGIAAARCFDDQMKPTTPPCAELTIRATPEVPACARRKTWVLAAAVLGSTMAFVDESVVNVALPRIEASLHTTLPAIQWIINAYTLCISALLLIHRRLSMLCQCPDSGTHYRVVEGRTHDRTPHLTELALDDGLVLHEARRLPRSSYSVGKHHQVITKASINLHAVAAVPAYLACGRGIYTGEPQ